MVLELRLATRGNRRPRSRSTWLRGLPPEDFRPVSAGFGAATRAFLRRVGGVSGPWLPDVFLAGHRDLRLLTTLRLVRGQDRRRAARASAVAAGASSTSPRSTGEAG